MDNHNRKRFAPLHTAVACGRDFCMQTSMNGFKHIAAPNRWWGERVLWACVLAAAIWGAVEISLGQWQRYNENPTVVALEKDFRSWEFCIPGLTICTKDRVDEMKLPTVIKKHWGVDPQDEKYGRYERFVRDVANSSMQYLADLLQYEGEDLEVDLFQLAVEVLPEMNLKATWSITGPIPWFAIMTEMGACYATNSMTIPDDAIVIPHPNETKMFPLTCKYSSLNCYITLESPIHTNFYVHSPYDIVNSRAIPLQASPRTDIQIELSVMQIGCGLGVRELSPRRRRCRYTDESVTTGRQIYSTDGCRRTCRNQEALRDCQCKPFYNPNEDGVPCSLQGMKCLAQRSERRARETARVKAMKRARAHTTPDKDVSKEDTSLITDACSCPIMCVDAQYEVLVLVPKTIDGPFARNGILRIKVQAPRTRYTREIVFYFQDLIVSFGGAAGLFLGASFISFVEIVFFAVERMLGSSAPREDSAPLKKTKVSHEEVRIQHLDSILNDLRHPEIPARSHIFVSK